MEWRDEGLIIGTRRHGETSLILEVMTRDHGRHLGLVKGGRGRRTAPLLQPGNEAVLTWRARLEEHLGFFAVEVTRLHSAELMADRASLHGLNVVGALLRLLAEREPHPNLLDQAVAVLATLGAERSGATALARFELSVLSESGFGIDAWECAATGATTDLAYISPKSARAVSRAAGEPYRARLLPRPAFLFDEGREPGGPADILAAFDLTGYFLARDLFSPRGTHLPEARNAYLAGLRDAFARSDDGALRGGD